MSLILFLQIIGLMSWLTLMIDYVNARKVERAVKAVAETHKACSHDE